MSIVSVPLSSWPQEIATIIRMFISAVLRIVKPERQILNA